MAINLFVCTGNIVADAEVQYVGNDNTPVCDFRLAIDRYNGPTDFADFVVWGPQAEAMAKHVGKGSSLTIKSEYRLEQWKDKETDENRSRARFRCDKIEFNRLKPTAAAQEAAAEGATAEQVADATSTVSVTA